jgi:catechol 2,3-dioxygenase-like lactoylglutathione lyase family enzyme
LDYAHGPVAQEPITLAFADLDPAIEFYRAMFGFVLEPDGGGALLRLPVEGYGHIALRLTQAPEPLDVSGIEVLLPSPEEVLDLYLLALLEGVPITHLQVCDGVLRTTMTDPGGHIIEIKARQHAACDPAAAPRRHPEHERPVAHAVIERQAPAVRAERWGGLDERPEPARQRRALYRGRRLGSGDEERMDRGG